jgi:hypothetical protein
VASGVREKDLERAQRQRRQDRGFFSHGHHGHTSAGGSTQDGRCARRRDAHVHRPKSSVGRRASQSVTNRLVVTE